MTRVVVKPIDKNKFELAFEYKYESKNQTIIIPKGFVTNGANIPRIFWSFFPPNSPEYLSAVVIHDFLYLQAKKSKKYQDAVLADEIFKEALRTLQVANYKIKIFYFSCKIYHLYKKYLGFYR